MTEAARALVERVPIRIEPDPSRVVNQLFVAGEEVTTGASRATTVMRRALGLAGDDVERILASVLERFSDRHDDLQADLLWHFDQIGDRIEGASDLPLSTRMLLGAYATSEYAVEAAALCNPSIVAHPDQRSVAVGAVRFVMSLRAIGEGHRSSIEWRTGTVDADGGIVVDDPGPRTASARLLPGSFERESFAALVDRPGSDVAPLVLDQLPDTFSRAELDASMAGIHTHVKGRRDGRQVLDGIRDAADSNYRVTFSSSSTLAQRILRPHGPSEAHGMEDARLVRFVDDDGAVTYRGTYTAFDGSRIAPQLLVTEDFCTFTVRQLTGPAAVNKGMALFPRLVGGRHMALSRWDRESNAVATSPDGLRWGGAVEVQSPSQDWELVQVGNCGSPIETDEGWLVLTHGVGPMRTYCIGALLLDLEDPTVVRGRLRTPLLEPVGAERDGYVPNVVYSCGALRHGRTLVVPYASGDRVTSFARVDLHGLVEALLAG